MQKHKLVLLGIFLLALFIRLYHLNSLPIDMHEDEILVGYVGRYILENGKDIYGNAWPLLFFNKFGDYYIIGPMYLSGLSTFIFGVNAFAVRFPAALFGSLVVFPVFFLASWMSGKKTVGLIAALLIAILPWHVSLSRTSAEGVIGMTPFLVAICLWIRALKNREATSVLSRVCLWRSMLFSVPFFLFSYWIYHPYRLLTPLVLIGSFVFFREVWKDKKKLVFSIFITLGFLALTLYISSTPWGKGRFDQTSIFGQGGGVQIVIQEGVFQEGSNNILLARVFHNKIWGYSREFLNQYFKHLSLNFLFVDGGVNTRFSIPQQGLVYFSMLIVLISLAIPFKLLKKISVDKNITWYLLFLFVIFPIPSALTYYDSPNMHRSVVLASTLVIFAALGIYRLTQTKFKKKFIIAFICLCFAVEGIYFWHQYSVHFNNFTSVGRNDSNKQVVEYMLKNKDKYKKVLLTSQNTFPLYYLFYKKDFSPSYVGKFNIDAQINGIDNIDFIPAECPSYRPEAIALPRNSLIIDKPDCGINKKFKLLEEVHGVNGLMKYKILLKKIR